MNLETPSSLSTMAETQYLMFETMHLEGQFTEVYFYPNRFQLVQKYKKRIIPVIFGMSFELNYRDSEEPGVLTIYFGDQKFEFKRFDWFRAQRWQTILQAYLIRKRTNSFKLLKKIGKGKSSIVFLAKDPNKDFKFAIKTFTKDNLLKENGLASLENEINVLKKLEHPNLIEFYRVYSTLGMIQLQLQYIDGFTLQEYLDRNKMINILQRRRIIKELLKGLIQLNRLNIVHRDLKPTNILLTFDLSAIKIIDFGLATDINQKKYIFTKCGTPGYVAPQIFKIKNNEEVRLGVQSDIFSLGVIYFQLVYGKPLFGGSNRQEVLRLNQEVKINFPQREQSIGFDQLQLIQNMLLVDPKKRITPENALNYLIFLENNE